MHRNSIHRFKWLAIIAAVLVMLAIAIATSPRPSSSSSGPAVLEGEAADIADFDDCVALQARFDGWYRNRHDFEPGVATDAMEADDAKMKELGCYDR